VNISKTFIRRLCFALGAILLYGPLAVYLCMMWRRFADPGQFIIFGYVVLVGGLSGAMAGTGVLLMLAGRKK
jgi:hypothetical protein